MFRWVLHQYKNVSFAKATTRYINNLKYNTKSYDEEKQPFFLDHTITLVQSYNATRQSYYINIQRTDGNAGSRVENAKIIRATIAYKEIMNPKAEAGIETINLGTILMLIEAQK